MDFLKEVIGIISSPWDHLVRHLGYIIKLEENVDSLKEEVDELKAMTEDVKMKVVVAERQPQQTRTKQVKRWLRKAEAVEDDLSDLERDVESFQERSRNNGNNFSNVWERYKIGKRVATKMEDVRELKKRKIDSEDVVTKTLPEHVNVIGCAPTVGLDSAFEKVETFLRDDDVGVIGIWGMGGVGKTTLLKRIRYEYQKDFDVVIWVVVSKEFSLHQIQKQIAKYLGFEQDPLATNIYNALNGKKFLLLLDDIWCRFDLEMVGIPYTNSQNQCKVLFTTRSEFTCGQMDAHQKIKMEPLEWDLAWDLFQKKVGKVMSSHPQIPRLAEDVARECNGLPLALVTIGRAMATKKELGEWIHAKTVLMKSASDFPGMEDEVLHLLKFSYENLRDDTMRLCFLFCSIYPEDDIILTKKLIDYWIGEGLIDGYEDIDEARNKGLDLVGGLKAASLLEDSDSVGADSVKMHDIIRDLAIWLATDFGKNKNKFVTHVGGVAKATEVGRWEVAVRVSLWKTEITKLRETPNCQNLLTLIIERNHQFCRVSKNFFQFMPLLRVLNLSSNELKRIPRGIGNLVELRHLDLSWTHIKKLPRELGNLVKLKHLNLSYTQSLKTIPCEVLGRLEKLEVLDITSSSYKDWEIESNGDDGHGVDLAELEGLKHLNDLGIIISTNSVIEKFLRSQILLKCTRKLEVNQFDNLARFELSSTFQNMENLKELQISSCSSMEELIIGTEMESTNQLLSRLETLDLQDLNILKYIWVPRGSLKNLRNLAIANCDLTNVTWIVHLRSLKHIFLSRCWEMEEVIDDRVRRAEEQIELPTLEVIDIQNVPKLRSICKQTSAFPSLAELSVLDCPKLKKLPLGPNNAKTLRKIFGGKKWWDELEWEVEGLKSTFDPCFKEFSSQ